MGAWGSLPAVHASDLRSGDLVLVRKQVHTSVGSLQPGLIRGVVSTSRGAYFSVQRQSLSGWTHVAMVLQHEQRLWLCEPGISGLKLSPLIARLRELKSDGSHVSYYGRRARHCQKTFARSLICVDYLVGVRSMWSGDSLCSGRMGGTRCSTVSLIVRQEA